MATAPPGATSAQELWQAASKDVAGSMPKQKGWKGRKGGTTAHMTSAPRFGSCFSYFRLNGSAIFSKSVLSRSILAACFAQGYYQMNQIRPEKGIANVSSFYFTVVGTCLSFLLVFKSNIAYQRFWEARTHAGTVCHGLRALTRDLVFATECAHGRDNAAIEAVVRYCNAFFALLLQDVRMSQDLNRISPAILTDLEKEELLSVRRRPLMVLGWVQLTIRDIKRRTNMDAQMYIRFVEGLSEISLAYHGCTKIRSQPIPFAYDQLIAMLTHLYCFTVPICFIESFGFYIGFPTLFMGFVYFGILHIGHELSDPFGTDANDVNLEVLMAQITDDLGAYVGKWTTVPAPPVVVNDYAQRGGVFDASGLGGGVIGGASGRSDDEGAMRAALKKRRGSSGGRSGQKGSPFMQAAGAGSSRGRSPSISEKSPSRRRSATGNSCLEAALASAADGGDSAAEGDAGALPIVGAEGVMPFVPGADPAAADDLGA